MSSSSQPIQSIGDSHHPAKRVKVPQFGLKELAPGTSPVIDIVAIHGIDGDREDSWTADNGVLWLKDLLPEKIPSARILTYGYDANTHDQEQVATDYMHEHAMTFISKLAILREETSVSGEFPKQELCLLDADKTTNRPIIFVVHSSGGILLKSALIHSHLSHDGHLKHHHAISHSTHGIAFFGTPHLGSATAELAQFLLDTISSPSKPTTTVLLQHIRRDSESLQHQLAQYSAISGNYVTKFCYELYDTHIPGMAARRVVPRSSAVVPGAVNAEPIGIHKDHINMIKFPSKDDEDFRTVAALLSLMSRNAPQNISEMVQTDNTSLKDIMTHLSLSNILRVDEARFDASSRPRCLEGTRVALLKTVTNWVEVDTFKENRRIFWLCGQAGTGKTTISLTVADVCQRKSQLAASFFFSRDHADRNDLRKVFPTIAHQLGIFHSPFKTLLAEVLKQDPAITSIDPTFQFEKLIIGPLKLCDTFPSPAVIVIDALDECVDDNPISKMVSILSANIQEVPHLKFFITSRPENHIMCGFRQFRTDTLTVILHDIEDSIADVDIDRYLRNRFSTISILYPDLVESDWPSEDSIKSLVRKSGRLFIFAATAMNFIQDSNYSDPCSQLGTLLDQSQGINPPSSSPFALLDQLYLQVLRQAFPSIHIPSERITLAKRILGAIVLLSDPLSPRSLESLLSLRRGCVRTTLRQLHSVIVLPDVDDYSIRLIHPSFFDFLTSRCLDPDFRIDPSVYHEQLAIACFEQMKALKRNICNIQDPSMLNIEIEDLADRVKQYISPSMQYACRYWSYHMCNTSKSTLLGFLETFCRAQVLYWIEALSLIDSLRDGIRQIKAIIKYLNGLPSPPKDLLATLKDTARFISNYFDAISVASLQLYRTALPLAPKSIYFPFKHEAKGGMQVLQGELDSSEMTTLCGPYHGVESVEFSPDGELIVSTSYRAILLWDRGTGTLLKRLEDSRSGKHGFQVIVWARVFPDGRRVISGSDTYTIRIWTIATGVCLESIQLERSDLDTKESPCYTCSPDFTRLVGTEDNNLLLWDTSNGALLNLLTNHSDMIFAVAFSPNGLFIASGSKDKTICIWDAVNSNALMMLRDHSSAVTSLAFSPNNKFLISGSWDNNTRLWDVANGAPLTTLKGHTGKINSIAFSPDGTSIIFGSDDKTIRVWDVTKGKMLKTIKCSGKVNNVQISPDGTQYIMSVSDVIYLWDLDHLPNFDRSKWDFCDVIFSPDGAHIISSCFGDSHIYLWDGSQGVLLEKLKGHSGSITSLTFAPDSKYFASGSRDRTIRLWDICQRRVLRVMTGHSDIIRSVAFAPDLTSIVSTSKDHTIRIWDVASGNSVVIVNHGPIDIYHAGFSLDGSQIVAADNTYYDIPLQFRSHSACSSNKDAEVFVYSEDGEWIFVSKGSDEKRCVSIPGAWRNHSMSFSHGRVAIGTPYGLVLLDLSGINLFI